MAIIALLFWLNTPVLAQGNHYDTSENSYEKYESSPTDYPKITSSEKQLYGKSFVSEDIYKRIQRLEQALFNKNFDSEELIDRVDRISDKMENGNKSNYSQDNDISSNLPINDINAIENRAFGRLFSNDNPVLRVERLEREILGATQSGDINDRIEKLKDAGSTQYSSSFNKDTFVDSDTSFSDDENNNFPLFGNSLSNYGSYSGNPQSGILNYIVPMVLPILQNLLNYNPNAQYGYPTPSNYQSNFSNTGGAKVQILE
jgi:hypothetical protein